jgi:RNA polymerase sigma-70 factor (ECF subfamily)
VTQDDLYREAAATFGGALERLAQSYEADADKRRDLLQEIHLGVWRSLATFDGQCSLRTWVYRVAHNVAASHVLRQRRLRSRGFVTLDEAEPLTAVSDPGSEVDHQQAINALYSLIHRLHPLERQIILLYLEGLDAASIGEVVGISAGNVATRVHRVKKILAAGFGKETRP